jgi:hypothetical protein
VAQKYTCSSWPDDGGSANVGHEAARLTGVGVLISIDEILTGVLVNAISATARMLRVPAAALIGRRRSQDVAIARSFDTRKLTNKPPALPDLSPVFVEQLGEVLRSHEVQAVLQELLSARLTKEPPGYLSGVKKIWIQTLTKKGFDYAADALFEHYNDQIYELVKRLEKEDPVLLRQIRDDKLHARIVAVLYAIERHLAALSAPLDHREEEDFLTRYRRHVIEYHGKIEPPDFERRRRIPFNDIYVPTSILQRAVAESTLGKNDPGAASGSSILKPGPPSFLHEKPTGATELSHQSLTGPKSSTARRNKGPEQVSFKELDVWAFTSLIDRTVLLGDPGAGKTTAANVIAHYFASDSTRRIPFFITLRTFAAQDPPERSVVEHIEYMLKNFYQCPAPAGLVNRLLLTGRAIMIFDGLDELLDTSRRIDVSTRVERFCSEYPLALALVTSRVVGYEQARLDDRDFTSFWLGGFDDDKFGEYVHKWFSQEEGLTPNEAEQATDAFKEESNSVPDLRTNPLLLSLMCILYRGEGSLPRNRAEVYDQCANLLFRKWDARRKIHTDLRASHLIEPAIRHLAWWLFTRERPQPTVTESELIAETTKFLHRRGFEMRDDPREAAAEFVEFCRGRMWVFSDVGTTAIGQHLYSFTHRTFLEYFAAAYLAYRSDTPEQLAEALAPHIIRRDWDVVAELAIQIKDRTSEEGAHRIYAVLLGSCSDMATIASGYMLEFLARCLRSVEPSPQMIRELTRACLDHFFAIQKTQSAERRDMQVDSGNPLGWLLGSPTSCRELVADELDAAIETMLGNADKVTKLNALAFADNLPWTLPVSLREGKPEWLYWHARSHDIIQAHAAAFINAAEADSNIRLLAVRHGLITAEQALKMPDGISFRR